MLTNNETAEDKGWETAISGGFQRHWFSIECAVVRLSMRDEDMVELTVPIASEMGGRVAVNNR
jgi:hypothetical protein